MQSTGRSNKKIVAEPKHSVESRGVRRCVRDEDALQSDLKLGEKTHARLKSRKSPEAKAVKRTNEKEGGEW